LQTVVVDPQMSKGHATEVGISYRSDFQPMELFGVSLTSGSLKG
jgi:hypothetical protein